MSVYNGEKHLREAIDSILNQTFTDFEFIIINDGSTDHTKQILESYSDPRIRLLHHENLGLTKSLNKGLKIATGEYIARMDADDISFSERLNCQVEFLYKNPEIGLVGTHALFIDQKDREIQIWKTPETHSEIESMLKFGNSFCHGSVLFKKECLDIVGYYREEFKYAQDYDYWLRISERFKTANINRVLYKNRRTTDTISRKNLSEQLNYHLLAQQLAKERRQKGADSLKHINTENVRSELIKKYNMSKFEINKIKSNTFLRKFSESLDSKDFVGAFIFWFKALLLEPEKRKVRMLAKAIIKTFRMGK